MNASFQSLADKIRQALGFSGKEEAVLTQKSARRSAAEMLGKKRVKVAAFAILFGVISALIELPLPAEDAYTAARAQLRGSAGKAPAPWAPPYSPTTSPIPNGMA